MKHRGRPALTPWFPGDVRPARPGVYQRRFMGSSFYAMWDGRRWRLGAFTVDELSVADTGTLSSIQSEPRAQWRGRRYPS